MAKVWRARSVEESRAHNSAGFAGGLLWAGQWAELAPKASTLLFPHPPLPLTSEGLVCGGVAFVLCRRWGLGGGVV